jgi:type I restriction enzyme M protein
VDEVSRERAQSFLTEAHIKRILTAYREFRETDGFSRVVTVEEIGANAGNLSIPLYVRRQRSAGEGSGANGDGASSLASAVAVWEQSSAELRVSMKEMFATFKEAGIGD